MTKISVIIPTYNRSHTLLKAVKSVLAQSVPIYEILICDDGSTDNSKELIDRINDDRVRWIEGKRAGRPAVPRNRGLKVAKGEWIAFLDSDDWWSEDKIEVQLSLLSLYNLRACCSNANRITPKDFEGKSYFNSTNKIIGFKELVQLNSVICSSALIHRDLASEIGFFSEKKELKAIEDYAYWLKVATKTDWVYSGNGLVNYMDDPDNSVRANGVSEFEQRGIILAEYLEWNNIQNSEQYKVVASALKSHNDSKQNKLVRKLKRLFS